MEVISGIIPSVKSMVKIMLQSRNADVRHQKPASDTIIILGNGPSLNRTIADHLPLLQSTDTMAVNFAANAPEFVLLRPRYYMLIDPHLFKDCDDANLARLWRSLNAVDWPMTLIVPCAERKKATRRLAVNKCVDVRTVNAVGVEGWRWLTDLAYTRGWGMPRPRNVLIPAIMAAAAMGYRKIYITGADHSWLQTLSVTENNEVVSVQPHFYKDDEQEIKRINTEYLHYPLHQIIYSFYVAFSAYHAIRSWADRHSIQIYNSTPGSYIDAFERRSLDAIKNDTSDR